MSILDHQSSTHKQSEPNIHEANKATINSTPTVIIDKKSFQNDSTHHYDHIDVKITKIRAKTEKL